MCECSEVTATKKKAKMENPADKLQSFSMTLACEKG
jgi:hypothetical protein